MIAAESHVPQTDRDRQHILIVDDDVDLVFPLNRALANRGFRVTQATDGNQGLAIIEFDPPALVILDLAMPRRGGLVTLEYLREKLDFRNPVIVITGIDGQRHRDYALALGADQFVPKPYAIDRLVALVENLVAGPPRSAK